MYLNTQVSILLNPLNRDERLLEGMVVSTSKFVSLTLANMQSKQFIEHDELFPIHRAHIHPAGCKQSCVNILRFASSMYLDVHTTGC